MCNSVDAGGGGGGGVSGGDPTFTFPGLPEIKVGDVLTHDEGQKIIDASKGQLHWSADGKHIVGKNPDGSGDVDIEIGKPLDAGQIHDLHHTVNGSGGIGNSNNMGSMPMNGHA